MKSVELRVKMMQSVDHWWCDLIAIYTASYFFAALNDNRKICYLCANIALNVNGIDQADIQDSFSTRI